jgi:hypothetical protein
MPPFTIGADGVLTLDRAAAATLPRGAYCAPVGATWAQPTPVLLDAVDLMIDLVP